MDARLLDELKLYVGFTDEHASTLASLRPLFEASARGVVDVFYQRIVEHPRARQAITGGQVQVGRLKETLRRWLVQLADGVYDKTYFESRAAIGTRHVLIDLPQAFMVTGMDVVRCQLATAIRNDVKDDVALRDRALDALHRILDIDLAIMLETYHDASLEKMRRAERRACVGELAASVHRELRESLGTIKSSAFLIEKQAGNLPEGVTKHLRRIQAGADRAATSVSAVLTLARELRPQVTPLDLNYVVREAAANVIRSPQVAIELELAPSLPAVDGDAELLLAAVTNLMQNAVEAHEGRAGRVTVRTALQDGNAVLLAVSDEGRGLTGEVERHLFQPFFTTKPQGAGLGLAVAKEIVLAHRGEIEARNLPSGKGAEFAVTLRTPCEKKT